MGDSIIKNQEIVIFRKRGGSVVYKDAYIKIKPDAIDISYRRDFRLLMYFPLDEVRKFEIVE